MFVWMGSCGVCFSSMFVVEGCSFDVLLFDLDGMFLDCEDVIYFENLWVLGEVWARGVYVMVVTGWFLVFVMFVLEFLGLESVVCVFSGAAS